MTKLINNVEQILLHAIEIEEKVPIERVKNFNELVNDIKSKLLELREIPNRLENPIIYHLDVGEFFFYFYYFPES